MSAWDDLNKLPEIIRFADLIRVLGDTPGGAKQRIIRWKSKGFIEPLGPRVGIYFNKVKQPDWESLLPQAVAMALPSAVVMGPTALHHFGWTTQIPQQLHVAIPWQRSIPILNGVSIHRRPRSWYAQLRPVDSGVQVFGLPAINPQQALEDNQAHPDECPLDWDDLDEYAIEDWHSENKNHTNAPLEPSNKKTKKKP